MKIETKAALRLRAVAEVAELESANMPTPLKDQNSKRKQVKPKVLFSRSAIAGADWTNRSEAHKLDQQLEASNNVNSRRGF